MTRRILFCAALVGAIGVVCAAQSSVVLPVSATIGIEALPVPLNPADLSQTAIGDFHYAGGLALTSRDSDQLHGLSDLEIAGADRLTAVGDLGILFDARLVYDMSLRLTGLTDGRVTRLMGEDGTPLTEKADADAEGLAVLPNGDRLVSFERRDRILLYPVAGGPPRPVPAPQVSFPPNGGMEALAAVPEAGADAYMVGAEVSGDTWTCRVSQASCTRGPTVDKPEEFGLVAIRPLSGGRIACLLRAFDATRGSRSSLQIFRSGNMVARMDMASPMTVDNFEGLAAVPINGGVRFYLISDDNAQASQRTLLLAFDWRPR